MVVVVVVVVGAMVVVEGQAFPILITMLVPSEHVAVKFGN